MTTEKKMPELEPVEEIAFKKYTQELFFEIPISELNEVLKQDCCELEPLFLGFVNVYKPLSMLIPPHKIVIDFGCYLAAQSYFFQDHKAYIGVDPIKMKRFEPPNAAHFEMTAQFFIRHVLPEFLKEYDINDFCAICSYVNDREATRMVRETFPNVFCYYPS